MIFCFTQTINEKKSLWVLNSWGRPQLFYPLLPWVTTLIATQEGVCCIAHSVKTFPKPFLWNESTSSIKHRKGTGSNVLKIPSDISSHLTQHTSEEQEHRILSEELRIIRQLQVGLPLPTHSSFSWDGGWKVKAKLLTGKTEKRCFKRNSYGVSKYHV